MARTYTPAIKFANQHGALKKTSQTVEASPQLPSDKTTLDSFYSGVVRKKRGSIWPIPMSRLFNPVPDYCNPPSIPPNASQLIMVSGSNFTPDCVVYFDGQPSIGTAYVNEHLLAATAPAHNPPGQEDLHVPVKVVRGDGATGSNSDIFRYEVFSSISSIVPSTGYNLGGIALGEITDINGVKFKPMSSVTFFSGTASFDVNGSWLSEQLVKVYAPAVDMTGVYSVRVNSPSGVTSSLGSYFYRFMKPILTSLSPITASTDEFLTGTVYGQYFRNGIIVAQSEENVTPTVPTWTEGGGWTFDSSWIQLSTIFDDSLSTRFVTYLPPASASDTGMRKVGVFNDDGTSGSLLDIWYQAGLPSITSFSPFFVSSGTIVSATGNHFVTPDPGSLKTVTAVPTAGGAEITLTTGTRTQTTFDFAVPASLTIGNSYYIKFSSSAGEFMTNVLSGTKTITMRAMPSITSLTPNSGGLAGGYNVSVTGSGFYTADTVFTVGSATSSLTAIFGSTSASITMPSNSAGIAYVTATNYADPLFSSTKSFMYTTASSINSGSNVLPDNG